MVELTLKRLSNVITVTPWVGVIWEASAWLMTSVDIFNGTSSGDFRHEGWEEMEIHYASMQSMWDLWQRFWISKVSAALLRSRIPSTTCLTRLINFFVNNPRELSQRQLLIGVGAWPKGEPMLWNSRVQIHLEVYPSASCWHQTLCSRDI
jgi:hypothetical protein